MELATRITTGVNRFRENIRAAEGTGIEEFEGPSQLERECDTYILKLEAENEEEREEGEKKLLQKLKLTSGQVGTLNDDPNRCV